MKFAYHMHGETMGELKLEKVYHDGTRTQIFHNTEVADAWKEQTVFLPMVTYYGYDNMDHYYGYEYYEVNIFLCQFLVLRRLFGFLNIS